MRLLQEQMMFGADELQVVKKILSVSTINSVKFYSDEEKRFAENLTKSFNKDSNNESAVYLCLKAASFGYDTETNFALNYIINVDKDIVNKYSNNVNSLIDLIKSKKIKHSKKVDIYLRNPSLYDRSEKDFIYAAQCFSAVKYEPKEYFDIKNGSVEVSFSALDKAIEFFTNADNNTKNNSTDVIKVDVKEDYFYESFSPSTTSKIIPSGVNGNDSNERTIWNYMEIWTNSVGRDRSDEERSERERTRRQEKNDAKNELEQKIKDLKLRDREEAELLKAIDVISR